MKKTSLFFNEAKRITKVLETMTITLPWVAIKSPY